MLDPQFQNTNNNLDESNTTNKKVILIVGALSFIAIVLIILIFVAMQRSPSVSTSQNAQPEAIESTPTQLLLPSPSITLIPSYPPTPVPQLGDIVIDGIAVNNFKEDPVRTEANGDLVLAENEDYQIIFNEADQKFILILSSEDFEAAQLNAENELMRILGLDEATMCRMYIIEQVPLSARNGKAGNEYPFSRCIHEEEP